MEQDRRKWNRIFSGRPEMAPSAPEFLSRQRDALNPGSVLDLACGDGAAALFLAEAGFQVTAVDIADAGLTRLQHFALQRGLDIKTQLLDLDQPAGLAGLALFDNIVISRFKPPAALWPYLVDQLAPEGVLALTTFNLAHHRATGFAERFCLAPAELQDIHPGLLLTQYESADQGDPAMDSYLFRRRC